MNDRRGFLRIFFLLIFFGVMNFLAMLSSPAWANIRGVDIVRLIGTGMCLEVQSFLLWYTFGAVAILED